MDQPPDPQKKNALTPVQIGAGVGAAGTLLVVFIYNQLARPLGAPADEPGPVPAVLMGVPAGFGGVLGAAVAALAGRRPK